MKLLVNVSLRFVQVVEGKDLSTNDFDNTYKGKIDNLHEVATSGDYTDLIDAPQTLTLLDIKEGNKTPKLVEGELLQEFYEALDWDNDEDSED